MRLAWYALFKLFDLIHFWGRIIGTPTHKMVLGFYQIEDMILPVTTKILYTGLADFYGVWFVLVV